MAIIGLIQGRVKAFYGLLYGGHITYTDGQNSLRSASEEKRFFEILFSSQKYRVKTVCK